MTEPSVGEWDHNTFDELRHALARAKQHPGSEGELKALDGKLQGARGWLLRLSNVPGPSDAAKQVVEKSEQYS